MSRSAAPSSDDDDPDLARQRGQRPLALPSEEALGLQLLLQLFEGELQRAEPLRLQMFADDLVFALGVVDAEPSAGNDVEARPRA